MTSEKEQHREADALIPKEGKNKATTSIPNHAWNWLAGKGGSTLMEARPRAELFYDPEIRELHQRYKQGLDELGNSHRQNVADLKEAHTKVVDDLGKMVDDLRKEVKDLKSDHRKGRDELGKIIDDLGKEAHDMRSDHRKELDHYREEIKTLKADHRDELKMVKADHQEEVRKLKAENDRLLLSLQTVKSGQS